MPFVEMVPLQGSRICLNGMYRFGPLGCHQNGEGSFRYLLTVASAAGGHPSAPNVSGVDSSGAGALGASSSMDTGMDIG